MSSPVCPSAEELSAFAVGNVSGTTFARIAEHLEGCRACDARLESFDQSPDELVAGLTQLHKATRNAHVPPEALTIARAAITAANGDALEISIDPGRRYARQLAS